MSTGETQGHGVGGELKRSGLVGPALDRLEQEVKRQFKESLEAIIRDQGSPRSALARRVASDDDLRSLADDPPQDLVAVLGPILCPMLNWVRMFDAGRSTKARKGWEPSESFERGQRALLNGWYDDALDAFRQTVEKDNPEDFQALFALGQLLIYWEDDAAAALPLLERAARYAVPMNAQPWMKRFAAESFLACAGLYADLNHDYDLALKQLDHAEQLTEPRPEIDLARAKIAARAGRHIDVGPAVQRAVSAEWLYAVQVALDPEFPQEVFEPVIEALDGERQRIRQEALGRADAARNCAAEALEGADLEYGSSMLRDSASRVQARLSKLDEYTSEAAASLLRDLSLAEKIEEQAAAIEVAAQEFEAARRTVEEEIRRASVGEQMLELQTQKDEVDKRLMVLIDTLGEGERRLEDQRKKTLERARQEIIQGGIMRLVWLVVPVLLLVLFYQYTTISVSPQLTIKFGKAATAPAITPSEPSGAAPQSPLMPREATEGEDSAGLTDVHGPVLAQTMTPTQTKQQAASGSSGPSYHAALDGWVWFLFFVYVLGMAGLTAKGQWEALQERERSIERNMEQEREKMERDAQLKRGPLEDRQRELTRRINELREQL